MTQKTNRKKILSNKINASFLRYFLLFSIIIIFLLWLFEVVLLKNFYQYTIETSFRSTATNISYNIQNNNLKGLIEKYAKDNNFSIRVLSIDNNSLDISVSSSPFNIFLSELEKDDILDYYEIAVNNNGQKTIVIEDNKFIKIEPDENKKLKNEYNPDQFLGDVPKNNVQANDYMLYTQVITINNSDYLFLGHSFLSPVETVSSTLLNQLRIVTLFFIAASILFSYIISKKFAKPISATNENARRLAEGNYNIDFNSKGFDEITELNETLNYACSELKKVDNLKKEIVSNISHDLRTPLTMISGYAELLKDVPSERTEENLQIIIDETNRLTSLVDDVVEINHISETKELELSDFSLTDLINNTIKVYTKMYSNEFNFEYRKDCNVIITADKTKITQVLYNLFNNAISYSKDSKIVKIEQLVKDNTVTITIINKGDNISKEDMPHIFERYYRAKSNHVRAKSGSGLGLSIVKNIIVLHKGEVNVISKNNINSFSFTLSFKEIV